MDNFMIAYVKLFVNLYEKLLKSVHFKGIVQKMKREHFSDTLYYCQKYFGTWFTRCLHVVPK